MDNFTTIYKILKRLEKAMDFDEFDETSIAPERLKISENRWIFIMELLCKEGYVDGLKITRGAGGDVSVSIEYLRITLYGLEFLEENTFMKKAANIAKGIIEIVR